MIKQEQNLISSPAPKGPGSPNEIKRPPIVVILGHIDHGKCVAPKTLVPLANGTISNIKQIWERYSRGLNKEEIYSTKDKKEGWRVSPKGLKIFTFNGKKVVTQPVRYIWKLKAPPRLVKVIFNSGDEVVVTPEHPFFILTSKGETKQKRADLLEEKEFVIVPQKFSLFTPSTVIRKKIIQKLRSLRNFVVFLNEEKAKKFLQKLQKVNKQEFYRKGLFSVDPYSAVRERRFRVRDFVKIGRYFGFSFQKLYKMIGSLKNASEKHRAGKTSNKIKLPKIPKDLKKLGYIIGCLAGDGQTPQGTLHNSNPEIQDFFRNYIEEVFNVTTKITKTRTSYKIENSGGKTLTRFLIEIGEFPRWDKSGRIRFPQIFSNLDFIRGFIAGWFDTDGYVSQINHSVEISSKSKDLIKEVAILLLHFGIHSKIYKQKRKAPGFKKKRVYYCLRIANNPYLKKFLNCFPIQHKEKKERIQVAIPKTSVSRIFDLIPIPGTSLYSFYIDDHLLPYFTQRRKYKFLSRYFLRKLLKLKNKVFLPEIFLKQEIENLVNPGEISCVKVRKIEHLKNKYKFVYDLTVPHFHNFVAERIFVHNTTLLDKIRKTQIAEKETGGITQHVGAYEVEFEGKKITFIDTPGHEAFSAMRARGAKVADIAILVVAADEGVQVQTKEAISYIKKAKIPLIVVINKIDKPAANPEKIKRELSKQEVVVESIGGEIPSVEVSAKTGKNIEDLLELILLVAEMEDLKGDRSKSAQGVVIESYLDSLRGPTATLLLRDGVLKLGDIVGTSSTFGKIKILENFRNEQIEKALPSMPVVCLGFEDVPQVGERFQVFNNFEEAKEYSERKKKEEVEKIGLVTGPGEKILNLILKTDVLGSIEAIQEVLKSIPQEKVALKILKADVGDISESDVKLAKSAGATILGFRVKINPIARNLAERERVWIGKFEIIYDVVEAVREWMVRILKPEVIRIDLGKVKTLVIFRTEKNRQIVGGKVIEGEVRKNRVSIEVFREDEKIGQGRLINLQINKKDVEKAKRGDECGVLYEGNVKIQEGDILIFFTEETKKAEL